MSLIDQIKAGFDAIFNDLGGRVDALESATSGKSVFPIWAEENGTLASNTHEWSWGNGSVGTNIGIVLPINCELFAVTFNADVAGSSVTILTEKNATTAATTTHLGQNSSVSFGTPVAYSTGDVVAFKTGTVVGSYTDCRVCAWFREI